MSYLVMEVHPAYAVVLDQEGRFFKAANLRYQVGDRVETIVELRPPRRSPAIAGRALTGLAGLAACLCLTFFGYYQPNFAPYGTLRIQINPDVEMTVSRTDRVLELEGLNADGEALIQGYSHRGKDREEATEELVERAIDMGYLSDGDTVSITVTSADPDWQSREEQAVQAQLEARYGESIVIHLGTSSGPETPPPGDDPPEVVIPVTPPAPAGEETWSSAPSTSSGGLPASGAHTGGGAGYEDTDYGPDADGSTGYDSGDRGEGAYVDGITDYEDREDDGDDQEDDGEDPDGPEDDGDDSDEDGGDGDDDDGDED